MDPEDTPWWRRRALVAGAVLVAVALVISGAFLLRQPHDRDRLAAGASHGGGYDVSDDDFAGEYHLRVPGATITVYVEAGHAASKENDPASPSTLKAPRDGELVGLAWSSIAGSDDEANYAGAHPVGTEDGMTAYAGGHPTRLSLRSRGTSVVVASTVVPTAQPDTGIEDTAPDKLVAVHGDLSDLELVATYEGRSQSVALATGRRTMGDFASLYATGVGGPAAGTWVDRHTSSRGFDKECSVTRPTVIRTPYLDSLGWAPAGREWVLADGAGYDLYDGEAAVWSEGTHYASYTVAKSWNATVTVNGRAPVKVLGEPESHTSSDVTARDGDYVFSVGAGDSLTIDIAESLTATRRPDGDPKAPPRTTLRLHSTGSYPSVVDPTSRRQQ